MRKRIAIPLLLVGLLVCGYVSAQVKIGDNPQTIDPSSVLELESTERVLVITRVDSLQMANIAPSRGALVYNTSADCVFYYNGTNWINLCNGAAGGDFTTDAIANEGGIPTIVITPTATGNNFEVAPNSISSDQITNGSIFAEDLNLGALDGDLLVPNSITRGKLSENSIGPFAIDRDSLPLSFFENDAGFITGANIVSGDANNVITAGGDGGAFYDDSALQTAVTTNTNAIGAVDQSPTNELQNLSFDSGTRTISLSGNGGSVTLPTAADEVDGDIENELITAYTVTGTTLTLTEGGTTFDIDLNALEGLGDGGGNQNLGQVLTQGNDGGSLLIKNILNPVDDQDAATKSYVDGAISSGGVPLNDGNILVGDATGAAQSVALSGDATVDNAGVLTIENDAIDSDKIADATIGLSDLNQMGATDNQIMKWDDDAASWTIASGASHSGDPKSIFFADENGDPTQYFHPISGGASLIWDYEARVRNGVAYGALGIGLDGGLINNEVKVHIAEIIANDVAYPLEVHNRWDTPGSSSGSGVGILFASDRYADGKGAIVFERRADYGVGDFHFLQNANNTAREAPELATDKAFTITSEKNIQLYGDLIAKNGAATAVGQVLTNTANGTEWASVGSGGTDDQTLNLTGNVLEIENGNTVDFTPLLGSGGSDDQTLTLTGNVVGIEDGNTIDLTPILGSGGADDQTLNLTGNVLEIENGNTVDFTPLLGSGGSDDQTLTLTGNVVGIEDGNTIDLTPILGSGGGTDDQNIAGSLLTGELLTIGIEGGNPQDVDLASFATETELAAAITASEALDGDNDDANELQAITSSDGSVSVTADGNDYDLTVSGGGTDDQNITGSLLTGELLTIGIEGGNPQDVDLASFATETELAAAITASEALDGDNDDANELQAITSSDGSVSVTQNGNDYDLVVSGGGTDDQHIIGSMLTGEILTIGIEGGDPQDVDLGSFATETELAAAITASEALDGDNDDANELQAITSSDGSVSVTQNGNDYDLVVGVISGGADGIIAENSISQGDIAPNAIGSSELDSDSVGESELKNDAVTTDKIVDGTILDADISTGISGLKIIPDFGAQDIITNGSVTVGSTVVHPDYVFEKYFKGTSKLKADYDFKTLQEIETFVKKHHHLPGIKSAAEVKKDGSWNLSESNLQNLEKIEELYLHTIEQEKKIDRLESEKETLSNELKALRTDLDEIKAMLKKSE